MTRKLRTCALAGSLALVTAVPGCDAPSHPTAGPEGSAAYSVAEDRSILASIRAATARFHDVDTALAEGYLVDSPCISSPAGGMGIHYANPRLLGVTSLARPVTGGDAILDWTEPEILLYEPGPDGQRRLVAVEYLVFAAPWDAQNSSPPALMGVPFEYAAGPHAHGFAPHYELHVWVWRQNPSGLTAKFNPKVSCS